jgi:hypothetical protein
MACWSVENANVRGDAKEGQSNDSIPEFFKGVHVLGHLYDGDGNRVKRSYRLAIGTNRTAPRRIKELGYEVQIRKAA